MKEEIIGIIKKVCKEKQIVYCDCDITISDHKNICKSDTFKATIELDRFLVVMETTTVVVDYFEEVFRKLELLKYTDYFFVNETKTKVGDNSVDILYGIIKDENRYKAIERERKINSILED